MVQPENEWVSNKRGKDKRGRGYGEVEKNKVMEWMAANPGRGTVGQAEKKFDVPSSTLRNWLKRLGEETKVKKKLGRPKKRGRPKGSFKNDSKTNIEKIKREAHVTDSHLNELMEKMGWPNQ